MLAKDPSLANIIMFPYVSRRFKCILVSGIRLTTGMSTVLIRYLVNSYLYIPKKIGRLDTSPK